MFIDETKINLKAGNGGNGVATLRREKFVPKGGPDGGDGGNGGSIYFTVDDNLDTLSYYNSNRSFKATNGEHGKNKKMHGRNGKDLFLKVPKGTIIYQIIDNHKKFIIDLKDDGQEIQICKGGKGGLGNVHFKSAINQTPKEFTFGKLGEKKEIILELKLVADVGLVGLPNAGKSTLISVISSARPKIANYPFTTVVPNLGALTYKDKRLIIADIPGLIENASEGKGLGIKFLKHIQRTKMIVHIVDVSTDVIKSIDIIDHELGTFDPNILRKKEIIVLNKIDTIDEKRLKKIEKEVEKKYKIKPISISAASNIGIDKLLDKIINTII